MREKAPLAPQNEHAKEKTAQGWLNAYKPTLIDKIFKLENKKREKLEMLLQKAISDDESEYLTKLDDYKNELNDYNELIETAGQICKGNIDSYKKVFSDLEPLTEISEIGSKIDFHFRNDKQLIIEMIAHDSQIIPKQSKSLLKSGKLTIKDLPIGRYNELYQDHICSASLRVAREIFGLLPVEEIIVTSKSLLLNKATGKLEDQPILSVKFMRKTISNLNFDMIDPSDAMANFIHNMGFKKSQGMSPVKELEFV